MANEKKETWEYDGKIWRKCPKCGKTILNEWKSHQCGWGKEEVNSEVKTENNGKDIFKYQCLNIAVELLKVNHKTTTPITEVSVNDIFIKAEEIYKTGKEKGY